MLLQETNSSGVALADYIYLNGWPVAVLNCSSLYYLHTDHLGTPQLATNGTPGHGQYHLRLWRLSRSFRLVLCCGLIHTEGSTKLSGNNVESTTCMCK